MHKKPIKSKQIELLSCQRSTTPDIEISKAKQSKCEDSSKKVSRFHLLNQSQKFFDQKKRKAFQLLFNLLSNKNDKITKGKINWESNYYQMLITESKI